MGLRGLGDGGFECRPHTLDFERREGDGVVVVFQKQGYVGKTLFEFFAKLDVVEFPNVKRIGFSARFGVVVAIRSRDDQLARRNQAPGRLIEKGSGILEMFDGLEGNDHVEGFRGERQSGAVALALIHIGGPVLGATQAQRLQGDIDGRDQRRSAGQTLGAITDAAPGVEYPSFADERFREAVAGDMFV